ncbi:Alpha/beta-glucosidase agdC, partial [Aureobasidium melanogenum]
MSGSGIAECLNNISHYRNGRSTDMAFHIVTVILLLFSFWLKRSTKHACTCPAQRASLPNLKPLSSSNNIPAWQVQNQALAAGHMLARGHMNRSEVGTGNGPSCGSSKEHATPHHIAPQDAARFGLEASSGQYAGLGASERQSRIRVQLQLVMTIDSQWLVAAASVTQVFASPHGLARRQNSLPIESCPGYKATNVQQISQGLTADLTLAGPACNTYGQDIENLKLEITQETGDRLHVQIYDADENVYQVPESVLPRPGADGNVSSTSSQLVFEVVNDPFSFAVSRRSGGPALFNTTGAELVFQSQYLRLRTQLPENPHLYGLGEHSDPFQLNTTNYTRTLWSRDAYSIPGGTNLYGNHPVYFDHRGADGTHGVFLLNSNGMDIKINSTAEAGQYLEYNTIGGIIDLYFLAGPSPTEVAKQYAEVVGLPAEMPYWGFGFHQCRYGYQDVYEVAAVVANYSAADIPLEVMWTDIDYMDSRRVFTTDPERFPLEKMRELVSTLHSRQQSYIVMVDPAVAYYNYSAFNNGVEANAFLKRSNGSIYQGVVWPGVTAFPDWFANGTQEYWDNEFTTFFNADTGVDIDALWIGDYLYTIRVIQKHTDNDEDMNEASNFCTWPCNDPFGYAAANGYPPTPPAVRENAGYPIPGFPADFQPGSTSRKIKRQSNTTTSHLGLSGRNLIDPPYTINNAAGSLSNKTIDTNLYHENGLAMYDTHNLYDRQEDRWSSHVVHSRVPVITSATGWVLTTRQALAGHGTGCRSPRCWSSLPSSRYPALTLSV